MSLHSKLVISLILALLALWMLSKFSQRKLSSGQVLFWLTGLVVGEVLTLSPALVDKISVLWGHMWPVSWISFASMVCLFSYMIHQSIEINRLQAQLATVTRKVAFLEESLRARQTEGDDAQ